VYRGTRSNIEYKDLLNNINQEEVFQSILGYYPDLVHKFKSPFRQDRNPGCRFEWRSGFLCLVENTRYKGKLYWNIFETVMELRSFTFPQSIQYIANGRYNLSASKAVYKDKLQIRFTKKQWSDNLFKLDGSILEKEHIFLVEDYWIGRNGQWSKNNLHPTRELCIAYYFPETDHVKLYFPFNKDIRWYSNCNNNDIFGYHSQFDSPNLIISKSAKDMVTLKYHYGYNAIALQNEGCLIPTNIVEELKLKYESIKIIFDNDLTGFEQASKLSALYDIPYQIIECEYNDIYEMYLNNYIL